MKDDGKSNKEITQYFHTRFGDPKLTHSTVAGWYDPDSRNNLEKLLESGAFNRADTTVNPVQSPRI